MMRFRKESEKIDNLINRHYFSFNHQAQFEVLSATLIRGAKPNSNERKNFIIFVELSTMDYIQLLYGKTGPFLRKRQ